MPPVRIADADCLNRFLLAPMCGVTSLPYRPLCREQGAGLLMTEMISTVSLSEATRRSLELMEFEAGEAPVGVQISGCPDIPAMVKAARLVQEHGATLLNLNCGCPVKKVIRGGSGSALLRDLDLLARICAAIRAAVDIPVTIKVRSGWDARNVNAVAVGRLAEDTGMDAIMLHARTREQAYEGKANWDLIRQLKQAVSIPVIGNGDVVTPADGFRMLETTGCDGIMIGRAAMGNPWIFRGLIAWERGVRDDSWLPTEAEQRATILEHYDRYADWAGPRGAALDFRKQIIWYTHRLPGGRGVRKQVKDLNQRGDLERILDTAFRPQPSAAAA